MPDTVRPREGKATSFTHVESVECATNIFKCQDRAFALNIERLERGAKIRNRFTIVTGQCDTSEALGDGLLITRVDVAPLTYIINNRLPGIGECQGIGLCFAKLCLVALARLRHLIAIVSQLHPVKREVALPPRLTPLLNHKPE